MGYCTAFCLFAHPVSNLEIADRIAEALCSCDIIGYALDGKYQLVEDGVEFSPCDAVKWYDHEENMRSISEKFPDVHFELHGEGEMNDDIWTQHFVNGKSQLCMAKIVIPPFDPSQLT